MNAQVVSQLALLRDMLDEARKNGKRIAAVPTMGALHEGHLSLVRQAKALSDLVVVTVFVNPTQFGPGEDFERYPRDLEKDVALSSFAGADIVFAPAVSEIYPNGEQTRVVVDGVSRGLCGDFRPGHFQGVATVVTKLFNVVGAGTYIFGQKDLQQLRVIERLSTDLLLPVKVVGAKIVREYDGLAMSSRNAYLSPEERTQATFLIRGLRAAQARYFAGEREEAALISQAMSVIEQAPFEIEYVSLRDFATLNEASGLSNDPVMLVAARLGRTRLIDNLRFADNADSDMQRGVRG